MFFKQMNDADEVITFVGQIMKLARENAKEMIESGRYSRPSNRCCDFNVKTSREKEMDVYFKRELDKRWLYSLFNFHFVYLPFVIIFISFQIQTSLPILIHPILIQ